MTAFPPAFETICIELVGEPKGKGRARFSRKSGVAFTPAATRSYEAALRYAAQEAMAGRPPLCGPLMLNLYAYMPIPQSKPKRWKLQAAMGIIRPTTTPDYDNLFKTLDALNNVVWVDDKQVVSWSGGKFYSERPRLAIEVSTIGGTV